MTNGIIIYSYSFEYSEEKSDVAIVLGAGTNNGQVSPIFRERINHSIYLFNEKRVQMILLTGGYGDGQSRSDSEIAREYLVNKGVPNEVIIIEKKSRYTVENLKESVHIMDSLGLKSALIVSDPLHMKRSIALAEKFMIDCKPSPTKTTMYRSFLPKAKSLMYETFYYSIDRIIGKI
ncbi:MAG: uncharacterized SAM-binding protein YcdF (DUF218 family) [Crocinitomicaceae bacterium]|jgi:uncharacterized SAM-binding protein YcdF (DUF218 family)